MDHGEEKLDRASKVESNDNGSGRSFASQKDRHGGRKSSAKVLHADNAAISSPDECKGAEAESNKGARDSNASFAVRRWNATPYSFLADMLPGATSMRKLFHAQSKASRRRRGRPSERSSLSCLHFSDGVTRSLRFIIPQFKS